MAFMRIEANTGWWVILETRNGTEYIGPDLVSPTLIDRDGNEIPDGEEVQVDELEPECLENLIADCQDYAESKLSPDTVYSVEIRLMSAARYSAPGYIDCTNWTFGNDEADAIAECREMYGSADDEDDEEDDTDD